MGQHDGLGWLEMGIARDQGVLVLVGPPDEDPLQRSQAFHQLAGRSPAPQAQVEGHLVVAAASGVEPLSGLSRQLGQPPLDRHMDVLVASLNREIALGELAPHLGQASLDGPQLLGFKKAGLCQSAGVCPRSGYVVSGQAEVTWQ
jgi:hypothetical protein